MDSGLVKVAMVFGIIIFGLAIFVVLMMFKNNYCLTVDKTRNGYSIGFKQNALEMPSAINYEPTIPMGIKVEELSSLDLDTEPNHGTRRLLGSERRKLPQDNDQIRHARLQYYSNSNI